MGEFTKYDNNESESQMVEGQKIIGQRELKQ